jgi:hypothetical protein
MVSFEFHSLFAALSLIEGLILRDVQLDPPIFAGQVWHSGNRWAKFLARVNSAIPTIEKRARDRNRSVFLLFNFQI